MTGAAMIAVALVALTAIGALVWAVRRGDVRGDERTDQLAKERFDHAATRLELERARFERDQHAKEIDAANRTIAALVKMQRSKHANADLPVTDVVTRLVRAAAEEARAAAADRASTVPAEPAPAVPPRAAADEAEDAEVLSAESLDPEQPLL